MKHPKKSFVSVVLAVAMVITCFLSFGGVSAAATVQTSRYDSVYYFYDYYPTAKQAELEAYLMTPSLILDGQNVTEDEFYALIQSGYFDIVDPESLVFIDIKTFKPDETELYNLLSSLRSRNCDIVLVATYTQSEFTNSSLYGCVDMYFETSFEQMEMFVKMSLDELFLSLNDDITGTCILIDGNMVDVLNAGANLSSLSAASPFLRFLLIELAKRLELDCLTDSSATITARTYKDIVDSLYYQYNVTLLAQRTNNSYRNLCTGGLVQTSAFSELSSLVAPSGTHFCAFGFWGLTSSFHDFLYTGQQLLGYNNLPVYVFEIESVVNSVSGLVVNTDVDMAEFYRDIYEDLDGEVYDERERFLEELLELMEILG